MKTKFNGILTLLLALVVQISFAQDKTISGTVSDESGPLPGVTVLKKGTTQGTETDFDGNFSIKAKDGEVLVFSFIGMKTVERAVGASNKINVLMEGDNILDEVVVTAFGRKQAKKELSYSATTVSSADINDVTNVNPLEGLSGKIAGVDLTTPAQTGASSKIILRGFTSLGNNNPLIIVDGSPINNSRSGNAGATRSTDAGSGLNDIDPNIIESISVLKGSSASALYGSRAGNGVILITTKKGKQGKLKVDLVSSVDFTEVSRVPHLQNSFGQGWNAHSYSSLPGGGSGASNENGSWGPRFNGQTRVWGHILNNSQQIKPYVALEDNIRDFYDTGNIFTNSVRVSGGSDNTNFSFGFTDTNADGVIPTKADAFKRRAINMSGGVNDGKLTLNVNANLVVRDQNLVAAGQGDNAGQGESLIQEIIQIPRDISLVDLEDYVNNPFNNNDNFYTPYSRNPYWTIKENGAKQKTNRFFGNANLRYQFNENLAATGQVGVDFSNSDRKSWGAKIAYSPDSPNALLGATANAGGVGEVRIKRTEYDLFFNLDYNKNISEDFELTALAGVAYNERQTDALSASITDLGDAGYYELPNTAGRTNALESDFKQRVYGVYGSTTLGYKDRVFLTLTGRNDWTSTLTTDNNSFFYPSVGLTGIVLDNGEHYAKLRGTWAQVANGAPAYRTASALFQANAAAYFGQLSFPIAGVNAFELGGRIGNPDIEPEITTEFEFGGEFRFFNNRINLDVAYYNKETDGVITSRPLAASTGFTTISQNLMDVENKGIEIALGITPVRTDDFKWIINTTFTKNENEVLDIIGGLDEITLNSSFGVNFVAEKGKPFGVFKTTGFAKTNDAGEVIVNSTTGIPLQVDDEREIGNSQRDFVLGLKNTFKYKDFTLNFSWDWKQGGEMYSYTKRLLAFTGNSIATTYNDRQPFIVPNSVIDNGDGTFSENTTPISFENVTGFYSMSNNPALENTHVIDKTFVRLTDVSLSYRLPNAFAEKIGLASATITTYGKNLFLWTPDENPYVDPEVSTFGNDLASEFGEFAGNPAQRTYGFSLKLTF